MFPVTDRLHIRCSVPGEKNDLIAPTKGSQFPGALAGRLEGHRLVGREDVVLERGGGRHDTEVQKARPTGFTS
jgi:hypothetical protein